ncbi:hypothetical protein [Sporanaerobium hydrogeniformans]|nr:hypothetical protein [Sporanaerobium hydrogeniformans]
MKKILFGFVFVLALLVGGLITTYKYKGYEVGEHYKNGLFVIREVNVSYV